MILIVGDFMFSMNGPNRSFCNTYLHKLESMPKSVQYRLFMMRCITRTLNINTKFQFSKKTGELEHAFIGGEPVKHKKTK